MVVQFWLFQKAIKYFIFLVCEHIGPALPAVKKGLHLWEKVGIICFPSVLFNTTSCKT